MFPPDARSANQSSLNSHRKHKPTGCPKSGTSKLSKGPLEPIAAAGDWLSWFPTPAASARSVTPARPPGPSPAVTCRRVSYGRTRRASPAIPPARLTATKPEHEATNTRTTILSLRHGSPLTGSQKLNATEAAADSRTNVGKDRSDVSDSRRFADESPAPPPRAEQEVGGARQPRGLTGIVVSVVPRVTRHCASSSRACFW